MRIGIREPLTAARTYYVRTDGSDSNDGLTDSSAGAFLTIQHAVDEVCHNLDLGEFGVTIQVRSGTFAENVALGSFLGTAAVTLRGDLSTPANVAIAPATGSALGISTTSRWIVEGFKLTSSNSHGVEATGPLRFQSIDFGSCAGFHIYCATGGYAFALGNYQVSGGAAAHITTDSSGATARLEGRTITVVNTPAFSTAFVYAVRGSAIIAASSTFTGAAPGTRYLVQSNSVVDTGSGGASFFPGNAGGSTATGGQYI